MITTMGYSSRPFGSPFGSPLNLQSSLFVTSRRPSIPLSPTLLPLGSFTSHQKRSDNVIKDHQYFSVHCLPVETLCDIFSLVGKSEACGREVTISHVCRRWRSIILCMPRLWSRISLRIPSKTSMLRVATYLRRSGTCPIYLRIVEDQVPSWTSSQDAALEELLQALRIHHAQLTTLQFDLRYSVRKVINHITGCQLSALVSLDVRLPSCTTSMVEDLATLFSGSKLTTLRWNGAPDLPVSSSWVNLTRLELSGRYTADMICSALTQCSSLLDLNVYTLFDQDSTAVPASITEAPKLQVFRITSQIDTGHLFRRLRMPSLQRLHIHQNLPYGAPRGWSELGNFLTLSSCRLESLELWDKRILDEDFIQCLRLQSLQSLASLRIHQPEISDKVLRAFSPQLDNLGGVLPQLETLGFPQCCSSDGLLKEVLVSRTIQAQCRPLKRLEVGFFGPHFIDETYIKSLENAGVNVVLG